MTGIRSERWTIAVSIQWKPVLRTASKGYALITGMFL